MDVTPPSPPPPAGFFLGPLPPIGESSGIRDSHSAPDSSTRSLVKSGSKLSALPVRTSVSENKRRLSVSSVNFVVQPNKVDFGVLKQGTTYRIPFNLINVGIETQRPKVKQPGNKNIRAIFLPGPVAPGISVKMEVECSAIEPGNFLEEIKIETDSEAAILLVTGSVASSEQADEPNAKARLIFGKRGLIPREQTNGD